MRKHVVTKGIVLSRTEYGEADRIVTLMTPDMGKVRVLAKAVRRPLSKLAGGIELFSVSNITLLPGRGELSTLVSTRLITHFGNIVHDVNRTMFGYDLLKVINRTTEDMVGQEYFDLLEAMLEALNDPAVNVSLIELILSMQLLTFSGHSPNLQTDVQGKPLEAGQKHLFNFDRMAFMPSNVGKFSTDHIKLLRLAQQGQKPTTLQKIKDLDKILPVANQLAVHIRHQYLRA